VESRVTPRVWFGQRLAVRGDGSSIFGFAIRRPDAQALRPAPRKLPLAASRKTTRNSARSRNSTPTLVRNQPFPNPSLPSTAITGANGRKRRKDEPVTGCTASEYLAATRPSRGGHDLLGQAMFPVAHCIIDRPRSHNPDKGQPHAFPLGRHQRRRSRAGTILEQQPAKTRPAG